MALGIAVLMTMRRIGVLLWLLLMLALASTSGAAQPAAPESSTTPDNAEVARQEGDAEDITEVIEDPTLPGTPVNQAPAGDHAQPVVSPAEVDRTEMTGWARQAFEWYPLRRSPPVEKGAIETLVPGDRFVSRTQLVLRSSLRRGNWLQLSASGFLEIEGRIQSSASGLEVEDPQSGMTLHPKLLELFVGLYGDDLDLRLGQQRVPWGRADVFSPNDVINARNLRDPFFGDPELRNLPTPLARVDWYIGDLSLQAILAPVFVPDDWTLFSGNWSALQPDSPSFYGALRSLITGTTDASVHDRLDEALTQTRLPNRMGHGVAYAFKLGLSTSGLDVNAYYHYGYDGTPALSIDPELLQALSTTDLSQVQRPQALAALTPLIANGLPFSATFVRRHHIGIDAAFTVGPFALRLDAAYQTRRVFYRAADLISVLSPTVLAVASLEYQTGDLEKMLIVEAVYVGIIEPVGDSLLIYDRHSYGFAAVAKWPLVWRIGSEIRAQLGIKPLYLVLQPTLTLKTTPLVFGLGALLFKGETGSLGWYLRHNSAAIVTVRHAF